MAQRIPPLTLTQFQELIHYDPEQGTFTWKVNRPPRGKAGAPAGAIMAGGRLYIYLQGHAYPAARIAWWVMTRGYPTEEIMFLDQDFTNHKWKNLILRSNTTGSTITPAAIQEAFAYNPETGVLTWKSTIGRSNARAGDAGCATEGERRLVRFNNRLMPKTHIIWVLQTGEFPPSNMHIDHKDRDPSNDRWSNLRLVTPQQNAGNRNDKPPRKDGLPRGVIQTGPGNYGYRIMFKGKRHGQNGYGSPEAAHEAYQRAHQKLHKAYSNYTS